MIVTDKLKILIEQVLKSPETIKFNGTSLRELKWSDKNNNIYTIWKKSNQFEFLKEGETPVLQEIDSLLFYNFSENHLFGDYIKVTSIDEISQNAEEGQVYLVESE